MRVSVLGSGSRGNSIYIEEDNTKILIDIGFSGKKIEELLKKIDVDINNIDAILVTHEHLDHIQGVGVVSRKYNIPIYITRESYIAGKMRLGEIDQKILNYIDTDPFYIGDIKIYPFDVMHDAERTVGYRLEGENIVAISTDIGYIDNIVRENFKGADIVIIECNYDYQMLMECNYPWELKARVKSRNGHLSNNDCARFLKDIYHENLKKIILAHMSQDSNDRKLAYNCVIEELLRAGINEIDIEIASQYDIVSYY